MALLLGGTLGTWGPVEFGRGVRNLVSPAWTTAAILLLMSASLDSRRLSEALRAPLASGWGTLANLGLMPLLAWPLALTQQLPDFTIGLVLTMVAPCTLATASVFTRRAGGNDAVSLVVTVATNILSLVVTPLWLQGLLSTTVDWDLPRLVQQLALFVLAPTILGQLFARARKLGPWLETRRQLCGQIAQGLVLLMVFTAALQAGGILREQPRAPSTAAIIWLTVSCCGVHLVGLWLVVLGGRALRLPTDDRMAAAFAGSQKTLPVSLLLAADPSIAASHVPFVTFPLIAYHAGQLLLDGAIADRWRRRNQE